ncbi:MAG: exodeoxyribonuclease I, partial [Rhodoferax sp.]|nr:exodeoxyribonuclease I [Rhodoferax sp.]
ANRNELIVWDLAQDPSELATLGAAEIRRRLFTRRDELPEGVERLPIKTIHANRSPIVFGKLKALGTATARWQIDVDQALRHAERAAALGGLLDG